ncbi:hypothetical protein DM860_017544 [Cuscuta australis]|uniref:Glabrous enhancer-binding protein-like DBD domain-containing protein n=1 Tax=Cuscuta australis TaxID=267555 RepID=A0A328DU93_9ASTE|nr:hypothetical protein DM860_017544 [Cuscuta australis]
MAAAARSETPRTPSTPIRKPQSSSESEIESDSESANDSSPKAPEPAPNRTLDDVKTKKKNKNKRKSAASPKTQEKKSAGKRVFSDEDQIVLLQAKIDYNSQKEEDALGNVTNFYDFVKDKLNVEVSRLQVSEKLRRLKRRFKDAAPSTSDPTDLKTFQLSQKIWGSEISSGSNALGRSKVKKRKAPKDEEIVVSKKMKQKIAVVEKDDQTVADEGKNDQTVGNENGEQIATNGVVQVGMENDQTIGNGNGEQIATNGVVEVGMENGEKDFRSKYPHFFKSLSAKYYPLTPEETLGTWKEKATLLDCSVAGKVQKKWANVWEEYEKLGGMVADLVSLQARLVRCEEVTL